MTAVGRKLPRAVHNEGSASCLPQADVKLFLKFHLSELFTVVLLFWGRGPWPTDDDLATVALANESEMDAMTSEFGR